MVQNSKQLLLNLNFHENYSKENFYKGDSHSEAYTWINSYEYWPNGVFILNGDSGSGKSHLCNIYKEKTNAIKLNKYFNVEEINNENNHLIIDDFDEIINTKEMEEKLFHLINRSYLHKSNLLLTTKINPKKMDIKLKDLKSRLNAAPCVIIHDPDDETFSLLLAKQLYDKGISLKPEVQEFAIKNCERSYKEIRSLSNYLYEIKTKKQTPISIFDIRNYIIN